VLRRARSWWNFRRAVRDASRVELTHPAGARDVVVLPCWRRPEFLWHCLDNLTRTDGFDELHLLFRPDTGFSPDNIEVIHSFADRMPSFQISLPDPCPFRRTKQSANLLLGYLLAAAEAMRYVFLVEEDTMVAQDFFRWHRAVQAAADPLYCSIASRNPNRLVTVPDDPEGYYLTSGDFCSGGVCFDKHRLQTLVAPHINMAYFRRPKKYLARQFPASAVGLGFVEQDGLLRRIQERAAMPIAFPCLPRCFNAGFYGYNRPGGLTGSVDDRVRRLACTIYSTEAMREAAASSFSEIYLPVSLQPRLWQAQRRIEVDLGQPAKSSLTPGRLH
jgi:hypothetical protein